MVSYKKFCISVILGSTLACSQVIAQSHGAAARIGSVKVAGLDLAVESHGEIAVGKEAAFEVSPADGNIKALDGLNLYLWVEDESGKQVSPPVKGSMEGSGLHFHVTPRVGELPPVKVTLRVRKAGVDERASLPITNTRAPEGNESKGDHHDSHHGHEHHGHDH